MFASLAQSFTNSKERGARATHVHPAPQLPKAHDNELRSLNCTSVPIFASLAQSFTNSKERGARATHVHPAPQLPKAYENELRSLNCTSVPIFASLAQSFTNSKERGARATHVHPAPQLPKAHENELRSLNCTRVPNLLALGQRVSELEGIRLKNGIVPCGHNFDPSRSPLTWHLCHTRVHVPCKFGVSATSPSEILSSSCHYFRKNRKIQNFDPPDFWTPLNFTIFKDLVTLHPCTKFGVSMSKGVGARGHKAEKRDCALRAQF